VKRVKSYAIALIALVLFVLVLGRVIRSLNIGARLGFATGQAGKEQAASSVALEARDKTSQPRKAAPAATAVAVPVRHIEGLVLHLSQPLLFEISDVRGLAAGQQFFYVAASGSQAQQAMLYRVRRDTCQMDGSRNLAIGSMSKLGGIHLGQPWLWVPLSQGAPVAATLILGLDPATLETKHTIAVNGQITAVAQGADGLIYGIDAQSGAFHVWNLDGKEIQQAGNSTGLVYTDLEVVKGRVLAVAVTKVESGGNTVVCGVIDVLDPVNFGLVTRHLSHARSMRGAQVTQAGFAFADGDFCFLPEDGKMAMLLTYRLDGPSLEEYVSPPKEGQ